MFPTSFGSTPANSMFSSVIRLHDDRLLVSEEIAPIYLLLHKKTYIKYDDIVGKRTFHIQHASKTKILLLLW